MIKKLIQSILPSASVPKTNTEDYSVVKETLYASTLKLIIEQISFKIEANSTHGLHSIEVNPIVENLINKYIKCKKLTNETDICNKVGEDIRSQLIEAFESMDYKVITSKRLGLGCSDAFYVTWSEEGFTNTIENVGKGYHEYFVYVTDNYHKEYFKKKKEERNNESNED